MIDIDGVHNVHSSGKPAIHVSSASRHYASHRYCLCKVVINSGRGFSCINRFGQETIGLLCFHAPAYRLTCLGIPAVAQDARARLHDLLMDRFDWFVFGLTLTCAALVGCLYW